MSDVKRAIVNEIHRQARINFPRRSAIVLGFDDLWESDIAVFNSYAHYNKGYKYVLVVIDAFSKYVWVRPLKSKSGNEVAGAMRSILDENLRKPNNLATDRGGEYFNTHFKKLMSEHSINHYSTFSTKKAFFAERVIRTLKSNLYKEFSFNGNYKWLDILQDVVDKYNSTVHRSIGLAPINVTFRTPLNRSNDDDDGAPPKPKFKVNDMVRISKYRGVFSKGYHPQFSTELFRISRVQSTRPTTYLLEDVRGAPIKGCFYEPELMKTKHPKSFLIERVLRTKNDQLYVKWLGFDNTHNSWIKKSDLL